MKTKKFVLLVMTAITTMAGSVNGQTTNEDYEQTVTPESPMDFTTRIINPGFETGIDGWTNEAGFKTFERATWRGIMDDVCISGNAYLNLFHNEAKTGRIVQTIKDIPNGVYAVKAGIFTNTPGANIFANDNIVPAEVNETKFYTVYTIVENHQIDFGYFSSHEKDFWSVADNFSITYYGNNDDAMQLYQEKNGGYSEEETAAAYEKLKETIQTAQSIIDYIGGDDYDRLDEEIQKAIDMTSHRQSSLSEIYSETMVLNEMIKNGREFKSAHDQLGQLVEELEQSIRKYRDTCSSQTVSDARQLLWDAQDAYYYIDRTTTTEMNQYINQINHMLEILPLPAFIDPDEQPEDYTSHIINPGFENQMEGWTNIPAFTECKPTNWANMLDGKYMSGTYYMNLFSHPDTGQAGTLYQTINNLPAGKYYIGASVFSNRDGLVFFANDIEIPIPIGPEKAPFGDFYGTYIKIEEGESLTFGVRTNTKVEFWGAVDNFTLTRYVKSESTDIQSFNINSNAVEIFTLSGNKIERLQEGINIVRDNKGNTRKVYVK